MTYVFKDRSELAQYFRERAPVTRAFAGRKGKRGEEDRALRTAIYKDAAEIIDQCVFHDLEPHAFCRKMELGDIMSFDTIAAETKKKPSVDQYQVTEQPLQLPQVNWNGTSKEELLKQAHAVHDRLKAALDFMYAAAPHGRDYQTMPAGSYDRARFQHEQRCAMVRAIMKDYEDLHIAIYDQHR